MSDVKSLRHVPAEKIELFTEEECEETHPGFKVTCRNCNSSRVVFENSLGFSELSGAWGEATLTCLDCNKSIELISS